MRPLKFWSLIAAAVFAAMTILWAFGDEPEGVIAILASVMWWVSALALVTFGLVAIWRFRRAPAEPPSRPPRDRTSDESRLPATSTRSSSRRRTPALSSRSNPSTLD